MSGTRTQSEAALVRRIQAVVKQAYPKAVVWKIADRFTRGIPDLLIFTPDVNGKAVVVGLEAKTKIGTQTAIQRDVQEKMTTAGADYVVVRSVPEALDAIERAVGGAFHAFR